MIRALTATTITLALSSSALAQFSNSPVSDTGFAWLLGGELTRTDSAPPIEAGDEIGVFFEGQLVGFVALNQTQASNQTYSGLFVFGDNPNTPDTEGPALNQVITFQYFDASTNTIIADARALNANGEPVNLQWQGGEVLNIPGLPLPPEVLFESAMVDLRIGAGSGDNGGGDNGGGGGETPTGNPDVNADGRVTREDAAMVLRVVTGGARTLDQATVARADVNGDGTVSTDDAIAVLRAQ